MWWNFAAKHVVEFCGEAIRDLSMEGSYLSMEGRMTLCNMAIEMES